MSRLFSSKPPEVAAHVARHASTDVSAGKRIAGAAATVAVVGGGLVGAGVFAADHFAQPTPSPSPSPASHSAPATTPAPVETSASAKTEAPVEQLSPFPSPSPSALPTDLGAPIASVNNVPLYFQGDARWGATPYAFSPGSSIGEVGCTETVVAMLARWSTGDASINPAWVNSGHFGEAVHDQSYRHLGDILGHPLMWLDESTGTGVGSYIKAGSALHAQLLDTVRDSITRQQPVALGMVVNAEATVPNVHGTIVTETGAVHSVLAVGIDAQNRILINDPGTGTVHPLDDYLTMPSYQGLYRADAAMKRE